MRMLARLLALLLLAAPATPEAKSQSAAATGVSPASGSTPAVLTKADLAYRCTATFPRTVDGQDVLYRMSGLALRRVGAALHAFVSLSGDIVEFRLSESCATPPVFVKNHGKIWRAWDGEPQAVTALHFRQTAPDGSGQLWVLASYFYHVTGSNDPHASVATFTGAAYTSSAGPYSLIGADYNKTRSGITSWLDDAKLLIGAGGHFAGVSSASLGLFAGTFAPLVLGATGTLFVQPLVDHPYDLFKGFPTSATRLGDYVSRGIPNAPDAGSWPQPENGVGRWQYYDGIDSFVYVTTGAKHGLLAFGEEATETITYDAGGACAGCQFRSYVRIYDPAKVAANAGKTLEPASYWRVGPGEMGDPDYGRVLSQHKDGQNLPLQTGAAFDRDARLLVQFHAKLAKTSPGAPDYERLPGLMLYAVGPAVAPPPPPPPTITCTVVSVLTPYADKDAKLAVRCNTNGTTPVAKGAALEVKK